MTPLPAVALSPFLVMAINTGIDLVTGLVAALANAPETPEEMKAKLLGISSRLKVTKAEVEAYKPKQV